MDKKVESIRKSKEANLSCQIVANSFSKISQVKNAKLLKIYGDELAKCAEQTDQIRRVLYCRICDNNSADFFKKANQKFYFKVQPYQCSNWIDRCSANLYLMNFFMRRQIIFCKKNRLFIIYKLATCSDQGEEGADKDRSFLIWEDIQLENWGKLCLGIPTTKSWESWLFQGGLDKEKKSDAEISKEAARKEWEAANHSSESTHDDNEIIMVERVILTIFLFLGK